MLVSATCYKASITIAVAHPLERNLGRHRLLLYDQTYDFYLLNIKMHKHIRVLKMPKQGGF